MYSNGGWLATRLVRRLFAHAPTRVAERHGMSICVSHIAGERRAGPFSKANSRYKNFVFDKKYLCGVFLRSAVGNPIPFCIAFAPARRVIEPPGRSAA